jgi:hypothetical protein
MSTAISNLKIKNKKSLQIQAYENIKLYLDDVGNDDNMIFKKLPSNLKNEDIFNIEEFTFNTMPGPFLKNLDITRNLLKNTNLDIF